MLGMMIGFVVLIGTQEMLNYLSSKMISTLWIFAMLVLKMMVMDRFFFSVC